MHTFMQQWRKYGTQITDESGRVVALHGIVKLGDRVVWLGRKEGKDTYDHLFEVGQAYEVCMIYESNGDLLLQGADPAVTIRAGRSEYQVKR